MSVDETPTRPRFYTCAVSFGWEVRDSTLGEHPLHVRVASFWTSEHGSWLEAMSAAQLERDRLNEEDAR